MNGFKRTINLPRQHEHLSDVPPYVAFILNGQTANTTSTFVPDSEALQT